MLAKRICEVCKKEYRPTYKHQKTCDRRCGVVLSNRSKAERRPWKTIICPECNTSLEIRPQSNQIYCSAACRNIGTGRLRKTIRYCQCGQSINGNASKKYCSPECRKQYSSLGKIHNGLPAQFKSAICLTCQIEFTRPASYTSQMMYCSNECAQKQQRIIRPVAGCRMTNVQIPDEVVDSLNEIAELRGLPDAGYALAEAVQVERQIAQAVHDGADIVVVQKGEQTYQILLPKVG